MNNEYNEMDDEGNYTRDHDETREERNTRQAQERQGRAWMKARDAARANHFTAANRYHHEGDRF